jgi:aryl-phospho-beta-D-glucosidase BglC (GH1 family)
LDFIQVENGQFVYKGKKIRLRGFGIGTWLCLEHFMLGLPASEKKIRFTYEKVYGSRFAKDFFSTYQKEFFQENDFKILKEHGVNFIRIPFNYRLFIDDNTNCYRSECFALFDHMFFLCEKYEIFALLDLHSAPGSQNPDWHSDNANGVPLFWEYKVFREQATRLWGKIAERYSDKPFLMGYDLLNEPAMANWESLNEYYMETIFEIRKFDTKHIIILEGDRFSMDFSGLKTFNDKQIAISFHYYPTVWHPDLLEKSLNREDRKRKIAEGLEKIVISTKHFGIPVFC